VDSIPTSAAREDHVSMGSIAARKLGAVVENVSNVLAVELLAAAQGIDLRKPLATSRRLQRAHALVRDCAAFWDRDRPFAPDLERMRASVESDAFESVVQVAADAHVSIAT
jgi:histidine ammonia-lyase